MHDPRISAVVCALLLALAGGCASTPEASRETDAEAKRFLPAQNVSIVYFYRSDVRGGVSTLWVDGRLLGESLPATYFRVPLRPGRHRVTTSGADAGRFELETHPDQVYFVAVQVTGETQSEANTFFRAAPPEAAKAAILRCCGMLEAWRPGQSRINF